MVIAGIEVHWLFEAESVDAFEAFTFVFDLLGVREVRQSQPTIIEHLATLCIFTGSQLVEVGHRVGLGDPTLADLIQVRLD